MEYVHDATTLLLFGHISVIVGGSQCRGVGIPRLVPLYIGNKALERDYVNSEFDNVTGLHLLNRLGICLSID